MPLLSFVIRPGRRAEILLALTLLPLLFGCTNEGEQLLVGTLERDRIELVAEAPEPIVRIEVREGDQVRKGQVLLQLDSAVLDAEVARAVAARERAAARLAELVRGPRAERIREAEAALGGAEGALAVAYKELERASRLQRGGIEAQAQLDRARAAYQEALARRDRAQAALDALRQGSTDEEIEQAKAALSEAEAAVETLKIRAARLTVRAPMDAHVDALPYRLGERPPVGGAVAVLLADHAPYARVYVPEDVRVRVRPGTAATVRVDGSERRYEGRVRSVAHDPAFTPHFAFTERDRGRLSYLAEVELTEPAARELPSGLPVEVLLSLEEKSS